MTEKKKWRRGLGNRGKHKSPKDVAAELAREERRRQAWNLKLQGRSDREIGAELGISHTQAQNDVREWSKQFGEKTRAHQRADASAALLWARQRCLTLGKEGAEPSVALAAVRTLARVEAVNARLNGLEAPVQIDIAPTTRDAYDDLTAAISGGQDEKTPDGETVQ